MSAAEAESSRVVSEDKKACQIFQFFKVPLLEQNADISCLGVFLSCMGSHLCGCLSWENHCSADLASCPLAGPTVANCFTEDQPTTMLPFL